MEYALLGPTGVRVSRVCLGTATFGVAPSEKDADRVVHAALDLGINFFDSADTSGSCRSSTGPALHLLPNASRPSGRSGAPFPDGGTKW